MPPLLSRTSHVDAVMLLMTAAFVLARTGRDALYFQEGGIRSLPIAYGGMALLALPMAALLLHLVRRLGARRARLVATGLMSAVLAVAAVVGTPGGGPAMTIFFMLVPVAFGGLFSLAWLLAGEMIGRNSPQLAEAFSRAGAASILGGLLGAGFARLVAPWIAPRGVLLVSALTLVAATIAMAITHRRVPPVVTPVLRGPLVVAPAFTTAIRQQYVRLLLAIAALAALSGVLIEFQFYLAASSSDAGARGSTALFAEFYLGLNLAALIMQRFVASRLQAAIGLTGSLLVLPAAILALMPAVLGAVSVMMPALMRLTEGGLKSSIHRVSWEQVYLPIGAGCRTEAKLLVDGVGTRLAEAFGALILYLWLTFGADRGAPWTGAGWLMYALLLASVLWLVLTVRARRHFETVVADAAAGDAAESFARMPDS